jgi:hypothetical protein
MISEYLEVSGERVTSYAGSFRVVRDVIEAESRLLELDQ